MLFRPLNQVISGQAQRAHLTGLERPSIHSQGINICITIIETHEVLVGRTRNHVQNQAIVKTSIKDGVIVSGYLLTDLSQVLCRLRIVNMVKALSIMLLSGIFDRANIKTDKVLIRIETLDMLGNLGLQGRCDNDEVFHLFDSPRW